MITAHGPQTSSTSVIFKLRSTVLEPHSSLLLQKLDERGNQLPSWFSGGSESDDWRIWPVAQTESTRLSSHSTPNESSFLMIQRKVLIKTTANANRAQLCENRRPTERSLDSGVNILALPQCRSTQGSWPLVNKPQRGNWSKNPLPSLRESPCLACLVTVHLSLSHPRADSQRQSTFIPASLFLSFCVSFENLLCSKSEF